MDQDKTISIKEFDNSVEAAIVEGMLKANGIDCYLTNTNNQYVMPFGSNKLSGICLYVFEKDKDLALSLIGDNNGILDADSDE